MTDYTRDLKIAATVVGVLAILAIPVQLLDGDYSIWRIFPNMAIAAISAGYVFTPKELLIRNKGVASTDVKKSKVQLVLFIVAGLFGISGVLMSPIFS